MSERTTGATDDQIEAAVDRWHTRTGFTDLRGAELNVLDWATDLIPPDSRIIALADLQRLLRMAWGPDRDDEQRSFLRQMRGLIDGGS